MKTIQTSSEIRKHSIVDASYRIEGLCDRILIYEELAFKDCLGLGFYEVLLDDLVQLPSEILDYDEENLYSINEYSIYREDVFKCIEVSQNEVPEASEKWEKVNKFSTLCFQELYDRYLKVYLSNFIVHNDIVFNTTQAANKGLMQYSKDSSGAETVDLKILYQWRRDTKQLYLDTLELIKLFLEKNKENCNFEEVAFFENCEEDCEVDGIDRIAW